jgi:hypothetical protein
MSGMPPKASATKTAQLSQDQSARILRVAQPDVAGDEQRHGRADGDGHRHADPLGPWRVGHPAGAASG